LPAAKKRLEAARQEIERLGGTAAIYSADVASETAAQLCKSDLPWPIAPFRCNPRIAAQNTQSSVLRTPSAPSCFMKTAVFG
jgi:hypothetical protein